MKTFLMFLSLVLPWELRRRFLEAQFGYILHPTSRIGLSWILPRELIMEERSTIGHLTLCKNISLLHLKAHSCIGNGNWITGFPLGPNRTRVHGVSHRRAGRLDIIWHRCGQKSLVW